MIRLLPAIIAVLAAAAAPSALAQPSDDALRPFYISGGLAWSGEAGIEIEAGAQWRIGEAFRLRLSPLNVSLIDGDVPDGVYLDSNNDCRIAGSNVLIIRDECSPEADTEWRALAEAQGRLAPGVYFGGGAAYLLQGDTGGDRLTPFASLAFDVGGGLGAEIRAGQDYFALRLHGLW